MFWVGSLWHEEQTDSPDNIPTTINNPATPVSNGKYIAFGVCVIACLGIWPIFSSYLVRANAATVSADLRHMQASWADAKPFTDWEPSYFPPNVQVRRYFQHASQSVGLAINYYRNQRPGSMLISSSNRILPAKGSPWNNLSTSIHTESILGHDLTVREEIIRNGSSSMLIWHWYWIDGHSCVNDYVGKLLQAREQLFLRGDDGAALFIFSPYVDKPEEARQTLRSFLTGNLSPLNALLSDNMQQNGGRRDE
jgi:EpsI family protein